PHTLFSGLTPDALALPDQKWIDVAEFLRGESRESEVVVAPEEFRYLCNAILSEVLSEDITRALKPEAVVVLHKGRLDRHPRVALAALASTVPIFANEVFVVLSKTGSSLAADILAHIGAVKEVIEARAV